MAEVKTRRLEAELEQGRSVLPDTGLLGWQAGEWANLEPVFVRCGETLVWKNPAFEYRLFFYAADIVPELIHTYSYQNESNWTTYRADLSDFGWKNGPHRFEQAGYFRVTARRAQGAQAQPAPKTLEDVAALERGEGGEQPCAAQAWIEEEAADVCKRVLSRRASGDFTAFILTDTHYATGCNWPDTLEGVRLCAAGLHPDAVLHLGDLTDGILPLRYTKRYALRVMDGLRALGAPFYLCIGNHDANYFRGNKEYLSNRQCGEFYLGKKTTSYFVDWPENRLRTVFLNSFEPKRRQRYGFGLRELLLMKRALLTLPDGWRVLVFSHLPPLARIHVWSDVIRNEQRILRMLESFEEKHKHAVLGWIHGHNHADQVCEERGIPIISVGCSKTEDFKEHKPDGSRTFERQPGTRTQELWDVLIVPKDGAGLEFIRFGAGEDRHILAEGK